MLFDVLIGMTTQQNVFAVVRSIAYYSYVKFDSIIHKLQKWHWSLKKSCKY